MIICHRSRSVGWLVGRSVGRWSVGRSDGWAVGVGHWSYDKMLV